MKNRESGQMLINLYVTTKCNLRCSYCYVDKSEQRDMDDCYIVYISQFIKKMIQTNNDNRVMINFFGGEPLLRRKLIENIITKVEDEITVDKKYIITTNGTLLTKDNVDFLKKYNFSVSLSVDGSPDNHNKERKLCSGEGSWEIIKNNLEYALKKFPNIMARMTFNSQTYKVLVSNIEYLSKIGFKIIKAIPDFFDNRWSDDDIERLKKVLLEAKKLYTEQLEPKGIKLSLFDVELKKCGDCTGGCYEFSIDVHGNIFPCTYSVEFPQFKLGNITELDKYIIPKYHIKEEERKACLGCKYFDYCVSGRCLFVNYKMSGKFYEPNGFFCSYQKLIYHIIEEA